MARSPDLLRLRHRRGPKSYFFNWESLLRPRIESAIQRTNTSNASLSQLQRHPGAGRFVGSSAIEDYFAVARNLCMARVELLGSKPQRAWNLHGVIVESEFVAQVHD